MASVRMWLFGTQCFLGGTSEKSTITHCWHMKNTYVQMNTLHFWLYFGFLTFTYLLVLYLSQLLLSSYNFVRHDTHCVRSWTLRVKSNLSFFLSFFPFFFLSFLLSFWRCRMMQRLRNKNSHVNLCASVCLSTSVQLIGGEFGYFYM